MKEYEFKGLNIRSCDYTIVDIKNVTFSFRFRADRKSFEDSLTMQDYIFYWRDMAPIIFKQVMIEAELTRKYKV